MESGEFVLRGPPTSPVLSPSNYGLQLAMTSLRSAFAAEAVIR
jgi:hypothetical protein